MGLSHTTPGLSNTPEPEGEHNITALLGMLRQLTDPRKPQGKQHELVFVLACIVVAVLAGATNYREVGSQVADLPQSLLAKLGARWCRFQDRYLYPSEPTLRRVMQKVNAEELDRLVGAWLFARARLDADGMLVIAVDGKVLRGAWTADNDQVTLFSAVLHDQAVTIAQLRVPDDTNEITQVKELLDQITPAEDDHVVVTLDAAHTQQQTAEYIAGERGFDYIMTLKGNQPALQEQVRDKCLPLLAGDPDHVVEERGHGRIKRWSTWITDAAGIDFPHLKQIGCIRRDVFDLDGVATSKEFALVLTGSPVHRTGPTEVHTHVRGHWGIENKSHYVRDTTWREDHHNAYTGNGPHVMATLRNLALGLLRLNGINKIKQVTEDICRDRNRALRYLAT